MFSPDIRGYLRRRNEDGARRSSIQAAAHKNSELPVAGTTKVRAETDGYPQITKEKRTIPHFVSPKLRGQEVIDNLAKSEQCKIVANLVKANC